MRLRLSPRENIFYELFSASAANILDGAQLLQKLVNAPVHQREDLHRQLRDAEHEGDDRTHSIMREVNSTFVTPIDREDIYRLASRLDDVMDFFEAAGDLIVLYKLEGCRGRSQRPDRDPGPCRGADRRWRCRG